MEKFKIDLFEKETGELFPSFQKLNQTDCNICYPVSYTHLTLPTKLEV